MATVTVVSALNNYFNKDENGKLIKRIADFNTELKALSPEEKLELAQGVVAVTGDTLK